MGTQLRWRSSDLTIKVSMWEVLVSRCNGQRIVLKAPVLFGWNQQVTVKVHPLDKEKHTQRRGSERNRRVAEVKDGIERSR